MPGGREAGDLLPAIGKQFEQFGRAAGDVEKIGGPLAFINEDLPFFHGKVGRGGGQACEIGVPNGAAHAAVPCIAPFADCASGAVGDNDGPHLHDLTPCVLLNAFVNAMSIRPGG
jgi:hypothetical protein